MQRDKQLLMTRGHSSQRGAQRTGDDCELRRQQAAVGAHAAQPQRLELERGRLGVELVAHGGHLGEARLRVCDGKVHMVGKARKGNHRWQSDKT